MSAFICASPAIRPRGTLAAAAACFAAQLDCAPKRPRPAGGLPPSCRRFWQRRSAEGVRIHRVGHTLDAIRQLDRCRTIRASRSGGRLRDLHCHRRSFEAALDGGVSCFPAWAAQRPAGKAWSSAMMRRSRRVFPPSKARSRSRSVAGFSWAGFCCGRRFDALMASDALPEHVPEKWPHFSDKDMLQVFELARILDRSGNSTR